MQFGACLHHKVGRAFFRLSRVMYIRFWSQVLIRFITRSFSFMCLEWVVRELKNPQIRLAKMIALR